ncbi:GNAT family N-acetyltransferase [Gulosibacter faecalis]|uniref:GNAT family N-acetyltransferase n=1 Tax=Gulosibacter faecalis TaxID=272240 RepID=A0ABW5UVG0_9MICO|nr:GNAT family N-acetyltransferase [Gulosibacter faecalis]
MAEINIRRATAADLDDLVRIHSRAWQETYAGKIRQERIDELNQPGARERTWLEAFADAEADPEVRPAIGFVDGEPAGLALARPSVDGDSPNATELKTLYTLAPAYGTGLGRALVDAVLGDRAAWLWMLDGNERAERFYAKLGFARFEEPVWRWPNASKPDVRLVRGAQGDREPSLDALPSLSEPTLSAVPVSRQAQPLEASPVPSA